MKGLYGFLGWSSEETADGTHKACTGMLMLEYLGHGETYRERQKHVERERRRKKRRNEGEGRRENNGKYNNLSKNDLENKNDYLTMKTMF